MLRTVPGTQGVFCKQLFLLPEALRWAARIRNFYTFAFLKHNCWSNSCSTSIALSLSTQWTPTLSFSPNLFCKWLKTTTIFINLIFLNEGWLFYRILNNHLLFLKILWLGGWFFCQSPWLPHVFSVRWQLELLEDHRWQEVLVRDLSFLLVAALVAIFSSVQFSCSVLSDSLQSHGLQHARPPCPLPTPGVNPNSCPLSWWCHPAISSSVVPFSSCPQSFPASGSFQMSQLFASGSQSIRVSTSASFLPMNILDWSPLGWAGWISLQSKGLSRIFSNTTVQKHQFFSTQVSLKSNSHIHTWLLEKPSPWLDGPLLAKYVCAF